MALRQFSDHPRALERRQPEEAVARALHAADQTLAAGTALSREWTEISQAEQHAYRHRARAAIAALEGMSAPRTAS